MRHRHGSHIGTATSALLAVMLGLQSPAAADDPGMRLAEASAAEPTETRVAWTMDTYFGGLRVGLVDVTARWQEGRYAMTSVVESAGALNYFVKSRMESTSTGTVLDGQLEPDSYVQRHQLQDDLRVVELAYDGTMPQVVTTDAEDGRDSDVPQAQRSGTLDPLSPFLQMMLAYDAGRSNPCEGSIPVFDGKRRYDLKLEYVKEIEIDEDTPLVGGNPGILCEMDFKTKAGEWRSGAENQPPTKIRIEFAKVDGDLLVPVKALSRTPIGAFVMVANRVEVSAPAATAVR